jgi:uncharacterized protein (DUF58 family)
VNTAPGPATAPPASAGSFTISPTHDRNQPVVSHAVDAKHRSRRRIRPTNATWYLLLVLFFVLAGAVNYQSNAAYLVLAVVVSTAVMSVLHAWRNLDGLTLTPGKTFAGFAGEPLRAHISLSAGGREHWALEIDVPEVADDDGVPVAHLRAGCSTTIELVLPARSRGRHFVRQVRVASMHPLGLLAVMSDVPTGWSWVVYPKPVFGGRRFMEAGDEQTAGLARVGQGDFAGHRTYVPGEPHRRIDWRAVARGRPWLVKEYTSGGNDQGWIAWDDDAIPEVELHLSVMAGRVIEAERQGQRYGLRLPGLTIAQNQGDDHYHACLQALGLFEVRP